MKMNKWLLIILAALAVVTVYMMTMRKTSTLRKELRDFAVEDTSAISRIFLADRNGNSVTLDRVNQGQWLLNHKDEPKYDLVTNLLVALNKVAVRSPVAKAAYNTVVKNLAVSAIKCEIYLHGDSIPAKTIYVGGQTEDELGTFMMLENSTVPFITYIPGFNGYLTPRFSVNSDIWQSNLLFSFRPGEIKTVLLEYAAVPEKSFLITAENNRYLVMNPIKNIFLEQPDSVAIENYLMQFGNIPYESVVEKKQRDTLTLPESSVYLSVKDRQNKLKEVRIFPVPLRSTSIAQTDSLGRPLKYDLDRVYGLINPGNKLVTIQQQLLNRLLRQIDDFNAAKSTNRLRNR